MVGWMLGKPIKLMVTQQAICLDLGKFFVKKSTHISIDAPPSSLMDSTTSPKAKTMEGEGVGVRSLTRSTLRVEGCAKAWAWD